jgi:cellobiose-specific phosphotransferase system component IIA
LIVVALSFLVLVSSSASLQQTAEKTKDLVLLFQNANTTVLNIFHQLEADGETLPLASLAEYNQALVLAGESDNLLKAGKYSEADEKIVQALQKLKDALTIVYATIPEQPTETEISLERTVQLKSSINRYYEQLQRIENLTRLADSVGYNTTTLVEKIQNIKELLDRALNNIEQKRFEAASENLAYAKNLSDLLLNFVNNFAVELKIQRIATYINMTQERLEEIRETAETLSNESSLAAVENAETSLDNAKVYLEEQRINDTLSELANSKASEDEAVEYLKPTASSVDATANKTPNVILSP